MKINRLKKQKHEYLIHTFSDEAFNGILYCKSGICHLCIGWLLKKFISFKLNIHFIPILHDGQQALTKVLDVIKELCWIDGFSSFSTDTSHIFRNNIIHNGIDYLK